MVTKMTKNYKLLQTTLLLQTTTFTTNEISFHSQQICLPLIYECKQIV